MKGGNPSPDPSTRVPYSGMCSLSGVLEQQRVVRAARAASLAESYLWAIRRTDRPTYDRTGEVVDGQLVRFPIVARTDKRVYFVAYHWPDDGRAVTDHVDAAQLARDGEAHVIGNGWPADYLNTFYATREAAEAVAHGDIKQLRRQMASVHPDRGGTAEQFMAARKRYERALRKQHRDPLRRAASA